ncbi:hypothetical protein [Thalassobacillus sp. CUG 92003]|uniref:hypothetical protein n=1 Tax=Thalassobacillus sp. CUG 92003 TaxID=2736641 RepID=UPI0015E7B53A|nr:hypothetical protein [Thalassobacillus sp. CUG 92003]
MKIGFKAFASTTFIVLFGWSMIAMFDGFVQLADAFHNPQSSLGITITVTPILAALVVIGVLSTMTFLKKRKTHHSWTKAFFLPPELEEADERERHITGEACRNAYIAMWYGFPLVTVLMFVYPFVSELIPYYPIMVLLLLPLIQSLVFFISWKTA